ncbi:unnamed protein product [Cunninghamella echinulata]
MILSKYFLVLVAIFYTFTLVASAAIKDTIQPRYNKVWKLGSNETISWDTQGFTDDYTATIFLEEDRGVTIAGGPATVGNYTFPVPIEFSKFKGKTVHVIIIFRSQWHLSGGATFPVKIQ